MDQNKLYSMHWYQLCATMSAKSAYSIANLLVRIAVININPKVAYIKPCISSIQWVTELLFFYVCFLAELGQACSYISYGPLQLLQLLHLSIIFTSELVHQICKLDQIALQSSFRNKPGVTVSIFSEKMLYKCLSC